MLGMVLLIGLVSGVVLVAAAGAWRTGTAYPRLLRWASATPGCAYYHRRPACLPTGGKRPGV